MLHPAGNIMSEKKKKNARWLKLAKKKVKCIKLRFLFFFFLIY